MSTYAKADGAWQRRSPAKSRLLEANSAIFKCYNSVRQIFILFYSTLQRFALQIHQWIDGLRYAASGTSRITVIELVMLCGWYFSCSVQLSISLTLFKLFSASPVVLLTCSLVRLCFSLRMLLTEITLFLLHEHQACIDVLSMTTCALFSLRHCLFSFHPWPGNGVFRTAAWSICRLLEVAPSLLMSRWPPSCEGHSRSLL